MNTCNKNIFSLKTLSEATVIGIITFIIGRIAFYLSKNKNDKENKKEFPKLSLVLFITGFFLHFIIELAGLNKWYCDKKCMSDLIIISKL